MPKITYLPPYNPHNLKRYKVYSKAAYKPAFSCIFTRQRRVEEEALPELKEKTIKTILRKRSRCENN